MTMNSDPSENPQSPDQPAADPATPQEQSANAAAPADAAAGATVDDRPSRKATLLAMGGVALALGLIWLAPGIGDRPPSQTATNAASGAQADGAADDGDMTGKPAPLQFTLKDMNGADVKLASFKGRVILLNFWATWCGPCRAEIPSLVELQQQYGKDIVILGVSVDDPVEKLKPYATNMKMNYPVLVGNGREDFQDAYGPLWGIPVSVFIDKDGNIAKRHSGIASKAQFEQQIKALL
jgi:thiol-disulfide isomerase/thioredoxin